MSRDPDRVDIEELLRHRPFVRALARSLVRDDARAEDVVSETWVAALRNPPRAASSLRAWLASVVRKLAWTQNRGERRRIQRERGSAPRKQPSLPEEALERAMWHRRLVDAVMELEEPYRTTILLRYFEELTAADIARLQNVPAATVRTRIRRGLTRLRERFDAEIEGGRTAWTAALLPLAFPDPGAPVPADAPSPSASWKVAAAGVAMLAGAIAITVLAIAPSGSRVRSGPEPREAERAFETDPVPGDTSTGEGEDEEDVALPHVLDVTVLADGRPVEQARVAVARSGDHPWRWNPHDGWNPVREASTDRAGRARFSGLPGPGYVRVGAVSAGRGRALAVAYLPQELPYPVVLELTRERRVPITVIDAREGRALADARVELREVPAGPWLPVTEIPGTDRSGWTELRGLAPGDRFRIRVVCAGYAPWGPGEPVEGEDTVVLLEPLDRTVEWPVAPGPVPTPPEGTSLRLRRANEPFESDDHRRGVIRNGRIRVEGLGRGGVPELLAVAEDGRFARLVAEAGERVADPVVFLRPGSLDVRLRSTEGRPLEGWTVRLRDRSSRSPYHPAGITDSAGTVRLPVYAADGAEVQVREGVFDSFATVRSFDPTEGDARMQVRLPAGRSVRVMVRCEGRPGLPESYRLYRGSIRVAPEEFDADASTGEIRLEARPARGSDSVAVHLLAPGYLPAAVNVPLMGQEEFDLELVRAGTLRVHVALRGEDQPYHLLLVPAAETRGNVRRGPWSFRLYPGPDHVVRERMLPPGTYRVLDTVSGIATEVFSAPPGAGEIRLHLDLREAEAVPAPNVRGRVFGYRDLDLGQAKVIVDCDGATQSVEVARDGSFAFTWSGEGPARLQPRHPRVPPSSGAVLELAQPGGDVALYLSPVHRARARLAGGVDLESLGETRPRVLLIRDGDRDGPLVLDARVDEETLSFSGYRPGRHRIWIDLPGHAPLVLRAVDLGEGESDLGALTPPRGSALRFQIVAGDEGVLPELTIAAQALGSPRYRRSVTTRDPADCVLRGLGPETFRVTAWERYTGHRVWSQEVSLDGTNDSTLLIDLR